MGNGLNPMHYSILPTHSHAIPYVTLAGRLALEGDHRAGRAGVDARGLTSIEAQSVDSIADKGTDGVSVPTSWSAGPNLPNPVVRAVGIYFPPNGLFYVMGGRSSDVAGEQPTHPFEYNPATNTWATKLGTYPDANVNNMACGVLTVAGTSQIFCVGGSAGGATTATARVFSYDPMTDVVTPLTVADNWPGSPGATPTILPGGFAVVANKLYIMGGFNIGVASTQQTWQFDPNAVVGSRWLQRQNYPVTRSYIPATAIGGIIYTAGGPNIVTTTVTDSADSFKYDPVADTWTPIPNIPRATGETRAVALNNQMWVLGGGRTAPNPSTQVDVFTPDRNQWTVGVPFTTPRRNFPADTDGSRVWLAGGYDTTGTGLLMTMERFQIPVAQSAVSRKTHGVNTFDVPLPLTGAAGVESRRGGGAGFNTHQAIVTFAPTSPSPASRS